MTMASRATTVARASTWTNKIQRATSAGHDHSAAVRPRSQMSLLLLPRFRRRIPVVHTSQVHSPRNSVDSLHSKDGRHRSQVLSSRRHCRPSLKRVIMQTARRPHHPPPRRPLRVPCPPPARLLTLAFPCHAPRRHRTCRVRRKVSTRRPQSVSTRRARSRAARAPRNATRSARATRARRASASA